MNKRILPVFLALALFGAGCFATKTVTLNTNANVANTNSGTQVSAVVAYSGQDGKNALELLQATHQVDVSDQGFVNAIDGKKPGDREFWALYVNTKLSDVGAKDYQTKTGDQVEWKLEKY